MLIANIFPMNLYQLKSAITDRSKLLGLCGFVSSKMIINVSRRTAQSLTTQINSKSSKCYSSRACDIRLRLLDGTVKRKIKSKPKVLEEYKFIKYCDIQQNITGFKGSVKDVAVLVFDIETTGFYKKMDRIIEFAIRDLRGGNESTFQTLVNPECFVPNEHIHHISTGMVNRPDIPRWKDVAPLLLHYIQSRRVNGGAVLLVAHNGRCFDVPFIANEFHRCSIEIPPDWFFLDTVPLARQLLKPDGTKLSSWSLQSLRDHYGIPSTEPTHRAMADVNVLSLILQKLTFDLRLPISGLLDRSFMVLKLAQASE